MADTVKPLEVPRPVPGVKVRSLPLSPEEAFVLSRVDGKSDARLIAHSTTLSEARVEEILWRLKTLGALEGPVRERHQPLIPSSIPEPSIRNAPDSEVVSVRAPITQEQKERIAALYALIDTATHYELLGVSPTADRDAIDAAYYAYVNTLHPDKFFRNELAESKPMLLKVFEKLTKAHETLRRADSRQKYDAKLNEKDRADTPRRERRVRPRKRK